MDSVLSFVKFLKDHVITHSGVLVVCVLATAVQVFLLSPMSPVGLSECTSPSSSFAHLSNGKLQGVIKLGEGLLNKPEDVAFDKMGVLYTTTRDGYIKRLHRNGTWDTFWQTDSDMDGLLGLTITAAGDLVVCHAHKGLIKVSEEGVTVLATHVDGARLRLADEVIESSDGMLYFSEASTKFYLHDWELDLLDDKPNGKLVKYDPSLNETSVVLDNLTFANGVALSTDEDYLVICESWKYRCLKYWLKGDAKGNTEIFIDNLPGGPDNINLAPDGSFWIALLQLTPCKLKYVRNLTRFQYLLDMFPVLRKLATGVRERAMVVNVASDGKIIKAFDDPTGAVMAFVTSAVEFENHLYLGNLHNNFIGKLPLEA